MAKISDIPEEVWLDFERKVAAENKRRQREVKELQRILDLADKKPLYSKRSDNNILRSL